MLLITPTTEVSGIYRMMEGKKAFMREYDITNNKNNKTININKYMNNKKNEKIKNKSSYNINDRNSNKVGIKNNSTTSYDRFNKNQMNVHGNNSNKNSNVENDNKNNNKNEMYMGSSHMFTNNKQQHSVLSSSNASFWIFSFSGIFFSLFLFIAIFYLFKKDKRQMNNYSKKDEDDEDDDDNDDDDDHMKSKQLKHVISAKRSKKKSRDVEMTSNEQPITEHLNHNGCLETALNNLGFLGDDDGNDGNSKNNKKTKNIDKKNNGGENSWVEFNYYW